MSRNIYSVTEFKRNTNLLMRRMKATGDPLLLTVNGHAALVVQDAEAYQSMLNRLKAAEAAEAARKAVAELERGEGEGQSPSEPLEELWRRHGLLG